MQKGHRYTAIRWLLKLAIMMWAAGLLLVVAGRAEAGTLPAVSHNVPAETEQPSPPPDLSCRLCHRDTEQVVTFPSGEELPAVVDQASLAHSVHGGGEQPLACTSCHPAASYQIPHRPLEAASLRAYRVAQAATCTRCHNPGHETSHPGPQAEEPVLCTDCHGSHQVEPVTVWQWPQATDVCLVCHQEEEQSRLAEVVRKGLFRATEPSDRCVACHTTAGLSKTFANGEQLSLTIDFNALHNSVHGVDNSWRALKCTDCHEGDYAFPHEPVNAVSPRDFTVQMYTLCARCHQNNYDKTLDSVHEQALESGKIEAAVCTDCHGAHDTPPPDVPRARISHTCEKCHSTIFNEYATSVHGDALLNQSNEDVPTCIDCHGVHNINDPTTILFRNRSPKLCAGCHADAELMTKYDISTDVFETYVADFHGTTVTLFEQLDPEAETNKAVCYDCHGVHAIKLPDDPDAGIKNNLLQTCRQCHPDATANFPAAWTSHFRPSLEHNPLVYLVQLFYRLLIPTVVGFFALLVLSDVYRRFRLRLFKSERNEP